MHPSFHCLCLTLLSLSGVLADFLGPSYPAPVDLSNSKSLVAAAWKNVTSTLQAYIKSDEQSSTSGLVVEIKNVTFSLGVFSLNDPGATDLQFHYTSPEIANAPNGTRKVNENSIYRIASLTKVFTVPVGLLNLKPNDWERPLTDIFPTLVDFAEKNPGEDNPIYLTQWDKVTPSALAAQIAGVTRDVFPFGAGDIILQILPERFYPGLGLPPVNVSEPEVDTPCTIQLLSNGTVCTTLPYLMSAEIQALFEPWTTPGYANNGFVLLGLAITTITGKTMQQLYQNSIFNPLGMTSSNSSTPPESEWHRCVIPGNLVNFAIDAGLLVSTGGLLSTSRDVARLGIGILNSTLLDSDQTRKWLKPVSHAARLQYSVGRPWEIIRYSHPSGHVTDMYTKLGDSGAYSSLMVLIPDYDAGFSILSASTLQTRAEVLSVIAETIADLLLPALQAQAGVEAEHNFVGTYTSTVHGLNSSLTLIHNQTESSPPGLVISSWISNGTDMTTRFSGAFGPAPWRLLPSIADAKNEKAAFLLVSNTDAPSLQSPTGLFSGTFVDFQDWVNVGSLTYGDLGVGSFVFDIGRHGKATAVTLPAFQVKLKRNP
ncbi:beta-lactamase/transpeptidase-like protein [Hyaloscypha hepaticicola]|uniref:Beta-lactamase/transpeptidase-like protein n=1 Tax=Hyaloscypha hepaticicola TaxID=2082293 RepID=A0A2J6PI72_9HELO|nr:beta-lactamase/transpeptidase-like protein [Hyaloscypha hepaticicola]